MVLPSVRHLLNFLKCPRLIIEKNCFDYYFLLSFQFSNFHKHDNCNFNIIISEMLQIKGTDTSNAQIKI